MQVLKNKGDEEIGGEMNRAVDTHKCPHRQSGWWAGIQSVSKTIKILRIATKMRILNNAQR